MNINANTKIAAILKENPDALEAIVSISPKFTKLRNPFLRKLMASRTSISMASKVGGCSVNDFFKKLKPLGFTIEEAEVADEASKPDPVPEFLKNVRPGEIIDLDVRAMLEEGNDPFNLIRQKLNELQAGQVLKIINTFEPTPLIHLMSRQGFEAYTEPYDANLVYTYFYRGGEAKKFEPEINNENEDWDSVLRKFDGKLRTIDVRELEMPLPMLTILEELETLPADKALYVYHKRIPVFLLPELQERKLDYRIREISDGEVHLLIFNP